MELEFGNMPAVSDFISVPAGTYLCEITDVRAGVTRNGEERWSFRLVVKEGEYAGRHAAWDSLTFTPRALPRVRRVFAAIGLPSEGKVHVEPKDLEGRRAYVEVRPAEYRSDLGNVIRRNEVPYGGYRPVPTPGDLPF